MWVRKTLEFSKVCLRKRHHPFPGLHGSFRSTSYSESLVTGQYIRLRGLSLRNVLSTTNINTAESE